MIRSDKAMIDTWAQKVIKVVLMAKTVPDDKLRDFKVGMRHACKQGAPFTLTGLHDAIYNLDTACDGKPDFRNTREAGKSTHAHGWSGSGGERGG